MVDAPERIWATYTAWDRRLVGISYGEVTGWPEYVRADLAEALSRAGKVKVEGPAIKEFRRIFHTTRFTTDIRYQPELIAAVLDEISSLSALETAARDTSPVVSHETGNVEDKPDAPEGHRCLCDKCSAVIEADVHVPDDLWSSIAPKPVEGFKGGGLLCAQCIVDALASAPEGQQPEIGEIMDDPWARVGFLKEKLRQAETERDEWKDRAFSLRATRPAVTDAAKLVYAEMDYAAALPGDQGEGLPPWGQDQHLMGRALKVAASFTRPAAVTEAMVEAAARLITKWLGFSWDGLRDGRVADKGFSVFTHRIQTGWQFQGGKGDMLDLARNALKAAMEAG